MVNVYQYKCDGLFNIFSFIKFKFKKNRLQISQLHGTGKIGCRPVATGNWGCGNSLKGDVQLKLVIQWMAASVSGIPLLLYYTSGNEKLTKVTCKGFNTVIDSK